MKPKSTVRNLLTYKKDKSGRAISLKYMLWIILLFFFLIGGIFLYPSVIDYACNHNNNQIPWYLDVFNALLNILIFLGDNIIRPVSLHTEYSVIHCKQASVDITPALLQPYSFLNAIKF